MRYLFITLQFFFNCLLYKSINSKVIPSELNNLDPNIKYFQGDITSVNYFFENLNDTNLEGAVSRKLSRWTDGVLYYEIDNSFFNEEEKKLIISTLRYVEDVTRINNKDCIKFLPRVSQTSYVRVIKANGCWSQVGMNRDGSQELSLGNGCLYKGIISHEFLHALGIFHEQSRPDRDEYIQIAFENIIEDMAYNFNKMSTDEIDTLDEPYDYESIMHYNEFAFSKNGKPTIVQIKNGPKIGQRDALSQIDINEVRKMYKCRASSVKTWNMDIESNLEWSFGCDFFGNDLIRKNTRGEDCGPLCRITSGCTHFTYNLLSGTCFLKQNKIKKEQYLKIDDSIAVCGLLKGPIIEIKSSQTSLSIETKSDGNVYMSKSNLEDSQFWTIEKTIEGFYLRNKATGFYLDSNSNGNIYTLTFNGGQFQVWNVIDGLKMVNRATNLLIETDNSNNVFTSKLNGLNSQNWNLNEIKLVQLQNAETGYILDSNQVGNVYTNEQFFNQYQSWIIEKVIGGLRLKNRATGRYLNYNDQIGLNTIESNNNSWDKNQIWTVNGFRLINLASGKALDSNFNRNAYVLEQNNGNFQNWNFILN